MFFLNHAKQLFLVILTVVLLSSFSVAGIGKAHQLNDEAYQNLKTGNYDRVHVLSKQALSLAISENNPTEQARALSNLASGFLYLGQTDKALEFYSESLIISRANDDIEGLDRALNNIVNVYDTLKKYKETLKYRKSQLANALASGEREYLLAAHLGLVDVYANIEETDKAKIQLAKSERLLSESPDPFLRIYFLFAKASLANKLEEHDSSIFSIKQALNIAKLNNYRGLIAATRAKLAEYYFYAEKYTEALNQATLSLDEAVALKLKPKQLDMHTLLSNIYAQKENFEKALEHNKRAQEISKSISGEKIHALVEITKIDRQMAETKQILRESQKDQKILTLRIEQQSQTQIIRLISLASLGILTLFIFYRISIKKELKRQQALNTQLRELDIVKDRVLTNTSHELRTPLNGIIGLSDIIIQDEKETLSSSTLNSLKLIKKSGEQLALVINDILEFSKLKSKKLTVINIDFSLTSLINEVIKVCEPSTANKDVVVKFESGDSTLDIHQDRGRVQQILFNVIGNAIKFTRQGEILVSASCKNNELTIRVKDSGIGIPDDKAERIFEGFEQVDSSDSREHAGSGLGLAISRGLAEALGGSLALSSTLGKGTEVEIRLPCRGLEP
ncbi:MAG: ATP-binding protein [Kangiellaceae bacterium]|nr:ATP-binding protein [Kangiellaceae bacterium]